MCLKYASPQPYDFWDSPAERDRSSDQRCHASAKGTSQCRGASSITLGNDIMQNHASPSHALLPRAFRHQQNRPKNHSRPRVPFGKTCCMVAYIKGKDKPLLVKALCTLPGCSFITVVLTRALLACKTLCRSPLIPLSAVLGIVIVLLVVFTSLPWFLGNRPATSF